MGTLGAVFAVTVDTHPAYTALILANTACFAVPNYQPLPQAPQRTRQFSWYRRVLPSGGAPWRWPLGGDVFLLAHERWVHNPPSTRSTHRVGPAPDPVLPFRW